MAIPLVYVGVMGRRERFSRTMLIALAIHLIVSSLVALLLCWYALAGYGGAALHDVVLLIPINALAGIAYFIILWRALLNDG